MYISYLHYICGEKMDKKEKNKQEIEAEKKDIKSMLMSSKRMYERNIREANNKISWYERQIKIIEKSLDKLEINSSLEV